MTQVVIVGCGAVTQQLHFPAVSSLVPPHQILLVDPDPRRHQPFVRAGASVRSDTLELPLGVTHAIVATPNHLHATVGSDLIERGIHVLVEKPLATTGEGLDRLADALRTPRAGNLHVGHVRRFFPQAHLARSLLRSGIMGAPRAFRVEEGDRYRWTSATAFRLDPAQAGGGVFMEIGPHVLDLLEFVFEGSLRVVRYGDNSQGGPETDCEVLVRLEGALRMQGSVELSWTRALAGTLTIEMDGGTVEIPTARPAAPRVRFSGADLPPLLVEAAAEDSYGPYFLAQAAAFLGAGDVGRLARAEGSIRLMREIIGAYGRRERLIEPGEIA